MNSHPLHFRRVQLTMDWPIPDYHASIVTPNGDIYLLGGRKSREPSVKYSEVFRVNLRERRLEPRASMLQRKDSHAVCYNDGYIYAIGGVILNKKKQTVSRACERYDIMMNKWVSLAQVRLPVSNHCACVFQKKYIFCFGGRCHPGKLSNYIFQYTIEKDFWTFIKPKMNELSINKFALTSQAACCQLNENQIFVFGGFHENRNASDQSFLFTYWKEEEVPTKMKSSVRRYEPQKESESKRDVCMVKGLNVKKTINAGPFLDKQIIAHQGKLFCLQNVLDPSNPTQVYVNTRRVLMFDGDEWKSLN